MRRDNIVRGFEYEKGKYVVVTDEEIRAANPEFTQTVDILAFVDAPDISFLSLDTPYYLAPDRKGEAGVTPKELEMAKRPIDDMSDSWDPSKYHDTFKDDILALVDRKVKKGKVAEVMKVEEGGEAKTSVDILDLSELLKRSLKGGAAVKKGASKTAAAASEDEEEETPPRPARKTAAHRKRA